MIVGTGGTCTPDSAPTHSLLPGSYMFETQYSGDARLNPLDRPRQSRWRSTGHTAAIIRAAEHPLLASHSRYRERIDAEPVEGDRPHFASRAAESDTHVEPPYVTYYVRLIAPSSSFQIDVNQSPTIPLPPLAALPRHVTLHNGNAKLMSLPAGSVTITPSRRDRRPQQRDPGRWLLHRDQVLHRQPGRPCVAVRHESPPSPTFSRRRSRRGAWCRNRP